LHPALAFGVVQATALVGEPIQGEQLIASDDHRELRALS
jgi:hypothetical protein